MLPSEIMIWQPEFTDKTLSRKPGAVQTVTDVRHGNNYSVMEYSDVRLESLPEFHFTKEYIQRGAK
ncbi:hypothetical protein CPH39_14410 [Escherichia coli]|nr:hypothetical protein CPH39_14410 [Escherichia coli]